MLRCRRPLIPAAFFAIAAFSLLAAGCAGGGAPGVASGASSTTAATTTVEYGASGARSGALAFARCMRSHGVARWPDPTATSQQDQRPFFRTEEVGIDPNAPQVTAAIHACQRFLDTNNPLVTTQ